MIFTSALPNDQDMIRALGSMAVPVPNIFTDACFSSIDEKLICIERKKCGDLAACINDGRFLFQMQNCKSAGADYLILILEGRYQRNSEDGLLEVPVWVPFVNAGGYHKRREEWQPVKPSMQFSRFTQFLWELPFLAGIFVLRSENVRGTADLILSLYDWFQRPEHHSLEQIFKPLVPTVQLVRPSLVRRMASELNGIGWEWSAIVANRFKSVKEMVDADVTTWSELENVSSSGKQRRLGKKVATKVVSSLH